MLPPPLPAAIASLGLSDPRCLPPPSRLCPRNPDREAGRLPPDPPSPPAERSRFDLAVTGVHATLT